MSIPFNEIEMPDKPKTKEQILAEMKHRWKRPLTRQPHYIYDGSSNGEQAHFELTNSDDPIYLEGFEDIPW